MFGKRSRIDFAEIGGDFSPVKNESWRAISFLAPTGSRWRKSVKLYIMIILYEDVLFPDKFRSKSRASIIHACQPHATIQESRGRIPPGFIARGGIGMSAKNVAGDSQA
jgi:hypothetical protein